MPQKALFLSSTKAEGTIRFKFLARFKDDDHDVPEPDENYGKDKGPAAGRGDVINFRTWDASLNKSAPASVSISIQ